MAQQHQQSPLPRPGGVRPYFAESQGRFALYRGDCMKIMGEFQPETFDVIFADPPYFLSNGGITFQAGKMVSVNKGKWDRSRGFEGNYAFTRDWLTRCKRLLRPNGTIWISGTSHIIHTVGAVLDELGYKVLNDITWVKPNPPPNLSCRYFTHATETIIWAGRDKKTRHKFNYQLMKRLNHGKQMTSVWTIKPPDKSEKVFGKHPTQKPVALLERIIAAASDEDDLVLDPFSGSGTTGIAAARLNRRFVGMETDDNYLRLAVLRKIAIPQADNPERIIRLVKLHRNFTRSTCETARKMDISQRQVQYYRQAAFALGLMTLKDGDWILTEHGIMIADSQNNNDDADKLLAGRILDFPLVKLAEKFARRRMSAKKQLEAIANLLYRATDLSEATCIRRTRTLLAWSVWARGILGQSKSCLDDLVVTPVVNETNDSPVAQKLQLLTNLGFDTSIVGMKRRQLRFKFIDIAN